MPQTYNGIRKEIWGTMLTKRLFQFVLVLIPLFGLIGQARPISAYALPDSKAFFQGTPSISIIVDPVVIKVNGTASAVVSLAGIPGSGYASAEFTCTYPSGMAQIVDIHATSLFGPDSVTAINGPQDGRFIVAIAGSGGNKALANGPVFTFGIKGLSAGQIVVACTARVSNGTNAINSIGAASVQLTSTAATATPSFLPTTPLPSPTRTATPHPVSSWLRYSNPKYSFEFYYPKEWSFVDTSDNHAHILLPFTPGTVLYEEYLDVTIVENSPLCRSPLAITSTVDSVGMAFVSGNIFLRESGHTRTPELIDAWFSFSTYRDNVCISFDLMVRVINPDSLSTPLPFFDIAAEAFVVQQVAGTFAWLPLPGVATDTPSIPPTVSTTLTPGDIRGSITGQVLANSDVWVELFGAGNLPVASVAAQPDGTFVMTAPAGTYNIVAHTFGFLPARGAVTILAGSTSTKRTITLLAGDFDGDYTINQYDAMTIGMNYNGRFPESADLNSDGLINVLDLELLARNYRKVGPTPW